MAAEGIAPGDPYTYNNNRFSTIEGQNNIGGLDINVKGDPALNRAVQKWLKVMILTVKKHLRKKKIKKVFCLK